MIEIIIQRPYPMGALKMSWERKLNSAEDSAPRESTTKSTTNSRILDALDQKEAQRKLSRAGRHASESSVISVSDENQTVAPSEISQRAQHPTLRNMGEPDADVKGEPSSQQQNGPISESSGNSSHGSGRVTQNHSQSDIHGVKNFLIRFRNGMRDSEPLTGDHERFMKEISKIKQPPNAADQSWAVENSNATPSGVPSSGSENNTEDHPSKME
jgi:hypothetical protein